MSLNGFGYFEEKYIVGYFLSTWLCHQCCNACKKLYVKTVTPLTIDRVLITFYLTRRKLPYGRQDLEWIVGPNYILGVFSTSRFAPNALSSVDDPD